MVKHLVTGGGAGMPEYVAALLKFGGSVIPGGIAKALLGPNRMGRLMSKALGWRVVQEGQHLPDVAHPTRRSSQ